MARQTRDRMVVLLRMVGEHFLVVSSIVIVVLDVQNQSCFRLFKQAVRKMACSLLASRAGLSLLGQLCHVVLSLLATRVFLRALLQGNPLLFDFFEVTCGLSCRVVVPSLVTCTRECILHVV